MAEKKYTSVTVHKDTAFKIDELRQILVDEGRANGSAGVDKLSLGDIVDIAVTATLQRRKLKDDEKSR